MIPIVTTYSVPKGRETYGRTWRETARRYWPEEWVPVIYADDDELPARQLSDVPDMVESFKARSPETATGRIPMVGWTKGDRQLGYSFRFDAVRFAWKAFTLLDASARFADRPSWVWLDADVVTHNRPPPDLWDALLPADIPIGFLERRKWSETGCLIFRPGADADGYKRFWGRYELAYNHGGIWSMAQWHDAWVFDQCRKEILTQNIGSMIEPVFETSPLGRYFRHLKGQQKGSFT